MIIIDSPSLIETFVDKPLTPSNWFEVTQEKIDEFAKIYRRFSMDTC